MGNALAVILGAVEREKAVPFLFTGSRNHRGIRPELAEVREVKAMMAVIERELENYKSLAELDFRAGYVAGRIYEKEAAGCITPGHKQDLINILYTKYETIRGLESWGAGCGL